MIIKLKREFTRRCLNHLKYSLIKILNLTYLILFFSLKNLIASEECKVSSNLKIGLIKNDFINYRYYIYYELDKYSLSKNIDFELSFVQNNIDEFDIIFGEWEDLYNLSLIDTSYPKPISNFYIENGIEIKKNILPLDLDTFLILSRQNNLISSLDKLISFYNPNRYTIGMSLIGNHNLIKLLSFTNQTEFINIKPQILDSTLVTFQKLYKNANKYILNENFIELYNSYKNRENVFTLFSDGIILYKNLKYNQFELFPQNNFLWNDEKGIFIENNNHNPISFFGLSAYINNSNQIGFLCHLVKEEVRISSFQNFNLQISPLSENEIKSLSNIPQEYLEILKFKNENIFKLNTFSKNYKVNLLKDIISGKKNVVEINSTKNYLN